MAGRWMEPIEETIVLLLAVLGHVLVLGGLFAGGAVIHHELIELGDPKAYDIVPWRYVADTADAGLIFSFIVYGTISFVAVIRNKGEDE